jgi:hypothetical protein
MSRSKGKGKEAKEEAAVPVYTQKVHVKIFIEGESVVRRFALDTPDWQGLQNAIKKCDIGDFCNDMIISYKDTEGDKIILENDESFDEALYDLATSYRTCLRITLAEDDDDSINTSSLSTEEEPPKTRPGSFLDRAVSAFSVATPQSAKPYPPPPPLAETVSLVQRGSNSNKKRVIATNY